MSSFSLSSILLSLLFTQSLAVPASKQPTSDPSKISTPFTDPATNISFERFFGARTTFGFGMALSTAADSTSFVGQMSFPLINGAGWGSLGLTGDMKNNFFLAAWADGNGGVMASFRQATNKDNPPQVTGNFAVRPIAQGTAVNNTFLTYTFLCQGCLDAGLGLGPAATNADAIMGWAMSEKAVRNPTDPGARLGFHERGFGPFTMRLGQSKNAQFDTWAAMAGPAVAASQTAKQAVAVFGAGGAAQAAAGGAKKGGKKGKAGGKKGGKNAQGAGGGDD